MFGEVVEMASTALPWRLTSLPDASDNATVDGFLKELLARDCSPLTVRSYGSGGGTLEAGSLVVHGTRLSRQTRATRRPFGALRGR
jgi:hypothetical protein